MRSFLKYNKKLKRIEHLNVVLGLLDGDERLSSFAFKQLSLFRAARLFFHPRDSCARQISANQQTLERNDRKGQQIRLNNLELLKIRFTLNHHINPVPTLAAPSIESPLRWPRRSLSRGLWPIEALRHSSYPPANLFFALQPSSRLRGSHNQHSDQRHHLVLLQRGSVSPAQRDGIREMSRLSIKLASTFYWQNCSAACTSC